MSHRPSNWNGVPVRHDAKVEELERELQVSGTRAWAAFTVLSRRPDPRALETLRRCIASSDWRFHRSALGAPVHHPMARAREHLFLQGLHDESVNVVRAACRAVAVYRLGLARAHDRVIGIHDDP